MLTYPDINPVAFSLGPLTIHWYGIMYLVAFGGAWAMATYRSRKQPGLWTDEQISDLVFYGALGAVLGGRMGSVFFYNFDRFLEDPTWLLRVWEGGMSFHGGLIGVLAAFFWYSRRLNKPFFEVMDFIAPFVPFGLAAGRLGNFIGGELWGRPTDVAWGMVFPHVDDLPRHASQLYQMCLEGLLLFVIVWVYSSRPRPRCAVTGLFGLGYGVFRFIVEFYREPDAHLGFVLCQWMSMGQLLSLPMIVIGAGMIWWAYQQPGAATPLQSSGAKT